MRNIGQVLRAVCRPSCDYDPAADLAWLIQNKQVDGPRILELMAVLSLNSVNPSLEGVPKAIHDARNGSLSQLNELLEEGAARASGTTSCPQGSTWPPSAPTYPSPGTSTRH